MKRHFRTASSRDRSADNCHSVTYVPPRRPRPHTQPKTKSSPSPESFSQRLVRLRKSRGLSQLALGKQIGISKRMVAYYETETDRPPAHLLPAIAKALAVSFDDLMGAGHLPSEPVEVDVRVWRRFQRLQSLPPGEKKTVLKLLDSLLDRYGAPSDESGD